MGRILLFSTQMLNTGGIESHILEFVRALSQQGHQIDILVPKCKISGRNKQNLTEYCSNVFIYDVQSPHANLLLLIMKAFQLSFVKYDALYTNGQGNAIFWACKLFRYKKHVHHHHTSGDEGDQQTWPKMYKSAMLKCNHLIACSTINAKRIAAYLNRTVITVPVFSRKMDVDINQLRDANDAIHFGYYGRLIPEKGIDTLIRLSNDPQCSHIVFHIWGEGPLYNSELFQSRSNINYHGSFNGASELKSILSRIDGYLLLSVHAEGLPVSLLEVMSAGLPWLATDKGGIPDLKIDAVSTRIIDCQSTYDQFKTAVLSFADDCSNNRMNRELSLSFYQNNFAADHLIHKWEAVLFEQNN